MTLTVERANKLSEFLQADIARAESLAALDPSEAVAQINANGFDFTEVELSEFGDAVRAAAAKANGELGVDALDDVAGGSAAVTILVGVVAALIGAVATLVSTLITTRKW